MGKWFNSNMSSDEARHVLCSFTKEQYEANKEEIKREYAEVLPIIMKRESDLAAEGWML